MNKQACWLCVNEGTFKDAGKCYICNSSRTSPHLPNNFEAKPIDEMIEILRKEINRLEDMKSGLPEIAPCIHCGRVHKLMMMSLSDTRYLVGRYTVGEECSSSGPSMKTEKEAILAWNRQNKREVEKEGEYVVNKQKIYKIIRVCDGAHWSGGEEGWGGRKAMLYYEDELFAINIPHQSCRYMINGEVFWNGPDGRVIAKAVEISY